MKTAVTILRGGLKGREGWISGALADREGKGIGKALVHVAGEEPEFYALSSLEEVRPSSPALAGRGERRQQETQASLFETQKDPPPGPGPTAVIDLSNFWRYIS